MTDDGVRWLWRSSRRVRLASFLVVAVTTLVFATMLLATPVKDLMRFGHDEFIFLGGGYRVYWGQRPHIDFHAPLGFVTPMLIGYAMKLCGPNASAIDLATVLFVLATTVWGYAIAWRRLPAPLAAAYALLIGAIGIGRFTLSFDYTEISVASIFNRYAYAVICILLLECALPLDRVKGSAGRADAIGGVSSGTALSLLFFIKASYVAQAAVFLAMSVFMVRRSRGRWIGVLFGAVGSAGVLLAVAHTNLRAVWADYAEGAASRLSGFAFHGSDSVFWEMTRRDAFSNTPAKLLEIGRIELWPVLALFGIAALVPGRRGLLTLTTVVLLSSIPIVFTNWQWGDIPTTPAFALVLCALARPDPYRAESSPSSTNEPLRFVAIAALAFFSWGGFVFKNYGSVAAACSWHDAYRGSALARAVHLSPPPLGDLSIFRSDGYCQVPYPTRINEGADMLEKLAPERPRVFVLDFSNPFPIALGLEPPRGDAMWWHIGATFNMEHALPAESALGNVDVVMYPKCAEENPTRDALQALYGPYIDLNFEKVDESDNWILSRRKVPSPRGEIVGKD